ncbi:hypothetical protein PO909_032969, partial [Leuciscus waleckii]
MYGLQLKKKNHASSHYRNATIIESETQNNAINTIALWLIVKIMSILSKYNYRTKVIIRIIR